MRVRNVQVACLVALAALLLLPPLAVRAEEEVAPKGVVDVGWHLDPLEAGLRELGSAPRDGGVENALLVAWRDNLKRRVGRMQRRAKDLKKKSYWVKDEEEDVIRGLEPGKWSPFVRGLASLHTELGTCAEGYGKVRASPERAMRRWTKAHPGPRPIGIVPSRAALEEIRRAILDLQLQNLVVPPHLWSAKRRLERAVWEEEEQAREERRREYEAAKQAARAAIEQDVATTNGQLAEVTELLQKGQRSLRALVSTTQQVEEYRLRQLLEAVTLSEEQQADVAKLFEKMKKSRAASLGFAEAHLSRYGAGIQQGWMVPRAALLKMIEKGKTRAER